MDVLDLDRDMSRNPLFDVVVVLQNTDINKGKEEQGLGDIKIRSYEGIEHTVSKFDLTFNFIETVEGLITNIEYNSDLYNRETIEMMSNHLVQLLEAILEAPGQPIQSLAYLSKEEEYELLHTFNDTAVEYPRDKTLVELFEEQVEKTPNNVAVVFEEKELSYRELNERSNQLADYLQKTYKIQPDDLVGIKLERSEQMIISMLGILKSGGAYVPIDPGYPEERISYMLEDSQCKVLIDKKEIKRFEKADKLKKYSKENLQKVTIPTNLAYVIYTSGSTGRPKGVLVEHKNVVRLFRTEEPLFDFSEKDVWTLFHSYAFDFSVWEMYGALLNGGKLILISKIVAQDPKTYLEVLRKEGVTILNQTPSAFYNLIKEALVNKAEDLDLRYVIFGGEALSPGKLGEWKKKYPNTKLINMYGITETTVHVTYKEITEEEITRDRSNIGKPIPTLSCYVLDQNQKLLPIGVEGELYVGGEGVARGYLNREELTKERFIENPYKEGERLYRSGDKVKLLENGEMEYKGRVDDQVKIRGYRIELGEIESVIRKQELVEEVVVLVREDEQGEKNLVAYIVSKEELTVTDLRAKLSKQLPDYMIPSHFVQLEELPLTPNGKIDKKGLPNPEGEGMNTGVEYVAPRNEI